MIVRDVLSDEVKRIVHNSIPLVAHFCAITEHAVRIVDLPHVCFNVLKRRNSLQVIPEIKHTPPGVSISLNPLIRAQSVTFQICLSSVIAALKRYL